MSVLRVRDLAVRFATRQGVAQAVRGVSLDVAAGETLAIVGESGCGKSVTARAMMGLLPDNARVTAGTVHFHDRSLWPLSPGALNRLRGNRMAMIFQDPLSALNPTLRIGAQVAEPLRVHRGLGRRAAWQRAVTLLEQVGIRQAAQRARQYPHEFSGGMLQRAMIAMALACEPEVLIADEPTTALDVTVQAQVLRLMRELQARTGTAIVLITHDLSIVAQLADRVAVMYAGVLAESGPVTSVFRRPGHPYTEALKGALPAMAERRGRLISIAGMPPDLRQPPSGCAFAPRCPKAMRVCEETPPVYRLGDQHTAACWWHHPQRADAPEATE